MATHTFGTNTTSSLTAITFNEANSDADFAAINGNIARDSYVAATSTVPYSPGPAGIVATGTTAASVTITSVAASAGAPLAAIQPGMRVLGIGIPAGASVVSFSGSTLVISAAATTSSAGTFLLIVPPEVRGNFSRQGMLYVPDRGVLQLRRNDVVAIDNTGWPILVSGGSANYGGTQWTFT